MQKAGSNKNLLRGDTAVLTDALTKAELLKEYFGGGVCGYEALFLALQDVGFRLHTENYPNQRFGSRSGWHMSVVLKQATGLTTKLYDHFSEAVVQAVVMTEAGLGRETDRYTSEQQKCKLFVDQLCYATESIFGFAYENFTDDGHNSFYREVRKGRSAAVSTMYTDGLYFWEIEGDGEEIMAIIHRLLLSGQSNTLNKLYKLFLNIVHYYLVTMFVNRFQKQTQENYLFREGTLVLSVSGQPDELMKKLSGYVLDINHSEVLSGFLNEVIVQGEEAQMSGRMPQLFKSLCEHGGGMILVPSYKGALLRQFIHKAAKSVVYMDVALIRHSKEHEALLRTFCGNTRVYGSIYAICGNDTGKIDYAEIAERFYSLTADSTLDLFEFALDAHFSGLSPANFGAAIVKLLEECIECGVKSLTAFCSAVEHGPVLFGSEDDDRVTELISELVMNSGDGLFVDNNVCDIYSRDKIEFPVSEVLHPVKDITTQDDAGRLDRFYVELIYRGPGNLGGMAVNAISFYDEAVPETAALNKSIAEFVKEIALECIKAPAAKVTPDLFVVHLKSQTDIENLSEYLKEVYSKAIDEILPEVNALDGWFSTLYRTSQKSPHMQKLRNSILKDNDALRADFLGRYIKYVRESKPDVVLRDFVSFATGGADEPIIALAEEAFTTVMQNSNSTITMILEETGKLNKFEDPQKKKALAFMEDKIFIDRLSGFASWIDVLGAQLVDEVNSKLSLDFTDYIGFGCTEKRKLRSRIDGEEYVAQRQGKTLNNNLSEAALVDALLESLYSICSEPA